MMRVYISILLLAAALAVAACQSDPASSGSASRQATGLPLDAPIILEVGPGIAPSKIERSDYWQHEATFSIESMGDRYNDLLVRFTTPCASQERVELRSVTGNWDALTYPLGRRDFCFPVITTHGELFSARGLNADDYVNNGTVEMRAEWARPDSLHGVRISEEYHQIPLLFPAVNTPVRIVMDSTTMTAYPHGLLISPGWGGELMGIGLDGQLLTRVSALGDDQSAHPEGLTFDGSGYWLSDRSGVIYRLDENLAVVGQFTAPRGPIAYADGSLWLSHGSDIHRIDPAASLASGTAAIIETIQPFTGIERDRVADLTSDGTHLLAVYRGVVYRIGTDGEIAGSWELQVNGAYAIAWVDDALWVLHMGPEWYMMSPSPPSLSRFLMPE